MAAKKLGRDGGNEGSHDDGEESGESGEDAIPSPPSPEDAGSQGYGEASPARGEVALNITTTPSKRAKKPPPASQEEDDAEDSGDASPARGGSLPDDGADAGHDNKSAATPKRGEKRSPPPLQAEERPEKRAAGPDAGTVAAAAPKRKKNRRKKKKKKHLRKALAEPTSPPPPPPPQEDEHHGWKMAEREPSKSTPPQDERRAREEEPQEKKIAEQDKGTHTASLAPPSPRLNLRSDPEPMGFWGVEVKPGEPYAHESSGRLRITQATLGNLESVDWSTIECSVNDRFPVKFCALNSTSVMYRLDQEFGQGQNVVFSAVGDSSVHLAGYYKIPHAAANIKGLVTQIQEADNRETTHVHGTAQEHNALDTEVHDDGTTPMVGQAGLNVTANVQALVTQSQEAADHKTTHAHDIAQGRNALETEVHTDCADQMVGQPALNIMIPDETSFGSSHRPVNKEPIDELQIQQLKLGDCNAEIASDGKKVKVEYIGRLMDGKIFDSNNGSPDICKFTLGAGRVIAGWHQGIKGMRVGEKRKLTIPPALAYKDEPQKEILDEPKNETIPANSWLVYEIELLEVSEPRKKRKMKSRSVNRH